MSWGCFFLINWIDIFSIISVRTTLLKGILLFFVYGNLYLMAWLGSCLGPPHSRYIMIIVLIERCGWKCDTKPRSGPPTVCLLALKSADLPGLWLSMIPLITHLNASVPMLVSLLSHTLKPLIGKLNETDDLITA